MGYVPEEKVRGMRVYRSFGVDGCTAPDEPSLRPLYARLSTHASVPPILFRKAKQEPLDRIPLDIQEALILEDLLYVLIVCSASTTHSRRVLTSQQGIEGTYITFHPDYSPEDDDLLQGIQFVTSTSLGWYPSSSPYIQIFPRRIPTRLGGTYTPTWHVLYCNHRFR